MEFLIVILVAVALVGLAFIGLALQVLFKKGGKFPNTHVGGNPYLQKQNISCAKTQDRMEQAKLKQEIDFKNIRFVAVDKSKVQG